MERIKKWRGLISKSVFLFVLIAMIYWSWQNRFIIQKVFVDLSGITLIELLILLTLSVICQTLSFTILVRGMGYPFGYLDSYHSLNLSQLASLVPGKIWGFAGLVGLLYSRGVSKSDSLLVIALQTILMLSAAIFVGAFSLISIIGWEYTLLSLLPVLILLFGHSWLKKITLKYFKGSSPLPKPWRLILVLFIGIVSWISVSMGFFILTYTVLGYWPVQPLNIIGAFPAGYVAGYISMITPSGLGVREGVISLIMAPLIGPEQGMALAIVFRIVHMAILWINMMISLTMLSIWGERK